MATRKPGRAVFYTRDSGGEHENTPGEYVKWAQRTAAAQGTLFTGTAEKIETMIRTGVPVSGDLFVDYGVKGNQLTRRALDALIRAAAADPSISHILIPRRDRLARPDDPFDGIAIETQLRQLGITLIFMDRVLPPLGRGPRDMGEMIVGIIDYDRAGRDRRDLAQKMLYAQLKLAREGYSTGGRAPYGFCRWLVKEDGTQVRNLQDKEWVKMAGHHVVWLPVEDARIWSNIHRIVDLLETTPGSRVAALLTSEGVPPPDFGKMRTDRGVTHVTSGVWHQVTVVGIARNSLLRAVVEYGRRSMGDQLRFDQTQPRELTDADLRDDGKPKVIENPPSKRITAPARFDPPVEPEKLERVIAVLDERGKAQRGKPRSQDPAQNPLGCRIFDCACWWPMYRQPYNKSFRYCCGRYQQSHGAECSHNTVDGIKATKFVLSCVQQRVLGPGFRDRLRGKLEEIARREMAQVDPIPGERAALQRSLEEVRRNLESAKRNMALAASPEQFQAISEIFEQLRREQQTQEERLQAVPTPTRARDVETEIEAAMRAYDAMKGCAKEPNNLGALGELFTQLNVRMFLRFETAKWGKRTVNKVSGGMVTFGATPAPISLYEGPTGRIALKSRPEMDTVPVGGGEATPKYLPETNTGPVLGGETIPMSRPKKNIEGAVCGSVTTQNPHVSGLKGDSLGNVSREDRTAIELFVAGVQGWEAGLRRRLGDGKPSSE